MKPVFALCAILLISACTPASDEAEPVSTLRTQDADQFAIAFLDSIQARSFASNREYCGLFGRDDDGFIVATPPIMGHMDSCQPPDTAYHFNTFASYHSHGGFDPAIDSEVPSSYDVVADREEGLIGYISTPGGRIWRSEKGEAELLCDIGCVRVDPKFEPGLYGPISMRYTADMLHRRETAN